MIKYAIRPGHVVSRTDGQVHYVGVAELMHLWGVRPSECIVIMHDDKIDNPRELEVLGPLESGRYFNHSLKVKL